MTRSMKFFQKVREIRSKRGILHFQRYAIFETSFLSLYIHRIYRRDEDEHLHSHPWNFITMVLWGAYTALDENMNLTRKGLGSWSWMTRHGYHKIFSIEKSPVTTIFLTYGKKGPWYYLVDGKPMFHETYRSMKNRGEL